MNAKKKNKKANKPPNPNPPQNLETVPKPEENVEKVVEKCEVKEEPVLTPVVCSEVVAATVSDDKEVEFESPKKPKRNKGKKKKQDKDEELLESIEKIQEVPQVPSVAAVRESVPEIILNILDEANIVPSARKKKNKKKAQEKASEELKTSDDVLVSVPAEQPDTIENVTSEIQEGLPPVTETPKPEPKKKKNKKKNRTDSERSDKSDTITSCTSAFQKLLVEDETPKQELPDIMAESHPVPETLLLESESKTNEKEKENKKADEPKHITGVKEPAKVQPQDIKEVIKDDGKGKKKNKKDKKQLQKEITEDSKTEVSQDVPVTVDDTPIQKTHSDEPNLDLKESIEIPSDSKKEKEPSPKPKAKIAKPVEKKRKGKQDEQSSDNLSFTESSESMKEDKKDLELPKEPEIHIVETPILDISESQVSDVPLLDSPPIPPKLVENINVPSDMHMGKKRKKSPKPSKSKEPHQVKEDVKVLEKTQAKIVSEILEFTTISDLTPPDSTISLIKSKDLPPNILEVSQGETPMLQETEKTESIEAKLVEQPLTSEISKDDDGFQTKVNKKKKKLPKTPQMELASEVQEPIIPATFKETENNQKSKEFVAEKVDIPVDVSTTAAGENVETDNSISKLLSCEAIPDVLFIRSSSQQLLDNNNNTVIQELINVEEIKINDPLQIPLIEGSGETPIRTPELVTSGIRMSDFESITPTEEKTDIKSKIIEVNQDMEELRLSIERSLAEFTAIEKCEIESEQKLEAKISITKEKSPLKDLKNKEKKMEKAIIPTEITKNIPVEVDKKKAAEQSSPIAPRVEKIPETPPVCPAKKDNKGKNKSKKKGKQETTSTTTASTGSTETQSKDNSKEEKQENSEQKSEQKSESTQEKGKQQAATVNDSDTDKKIDVNYEEPLDSETMNDFTEQNDFDPIENFEDALTSSVDDVNKTFEMIVKDADDDNKEFQKKLAANKPEINITEPIEDTNTKRNEKINPVSQPKNLLGQTDIPVQSNKTDYKREKNKTPNARQARVKIKDSTEIEAKKQSKESQTDIKRARNIADKSVKESFSRVKNDTEEYVYKYSFRKVFLQSVCHVCNKDLKQVRVPCGYCSLVFYCGAKHKDENWPQHQALCFAVSTLAHMKDQKHIYADTQNTTGQDYRLLRMQMIVSCEKVLKRRLVPWEQEAMLYPRMCADSACREWRQSKLRDCDGCGQLSYCSDHPDHLPKSHGRWCKSYSLYQKLVSYQQTKGRLEPRLPTKVMKQCDLPGKMNEVLATMYEEKIDMNDIQYAALTQLATAPLTAAHCLQLGRKVTSITNGVYEKKSFTIHVVGAELQFEADVLNKWEVFFLHLRPDVEELKVVLVSPMLNPGNLPLDLLGRIKLCDKCHQNKRRVVFKFEDNKNYFEYRTSEDFINPDIICAFNPSIQRSSIYNGKDPWPATINSILKLKQPFIITSYTLSELRKDIARVKEVADLDFKLVLEAGFNSFASVRPDRNFISDDEMPLLFKNYCVAVVLGC